MFLMFILLSMSQIKLVILYIFDATYGSVFILNLQISLLVSLRICIILYLIVIIKWIISHVKIKQGCL